MSVFKMKNRVNLLRSYKILNSIFLKLVPRTSYFVSNNTCVNKNGNKAMYPKITFTMEERNRIKRKIRLERVNKLIRIKIKSTFVSTKEKRTFHAFILTSFYEHVGKLL